MAVIFKRLVILLAATWFGCACSVNTEPADLRTLERRSSPNDALACPPSTCTAKAEMDSPSFDLQAGQLVEIVRNVISAQARTELVDEDPEIGQLVFVQRSRIFGFADTIRIQAVELESQSSLIVYSRSNFGYWDLGVNRRRVRDWLSEIESAATGRAGR